MIITLLIAVLQRLARNAAASVFSQTRAFQRCTWSETLILKMHRTSYLSERLWFANPAHLHSCTLIFFFVFLANVSFFPGLIKPQQLWRWWNSRPCLGYSWAQSSLFKPSSLFPKNALARFTLPLSPVEESGKWMAPLIMNRAVSVEPNGTRKTRLLCWIRKSRSVMHNFS